MRSVRPMMLLCGVAAWAGCSDPAQLDEPDAGGGLVGDAAIDCPPGESDGGPDGMPDGTPDGMVDAGVDGAPDVTAPTVTMIQPAPNSSIWLHEPICITFDEAIDASSAQVIVRAGTVTIPATLARSGTHALVVAIDPSAHALGPLSIEVGGSIVDLAGNALAEPVLVAYDLPAWQLGELAPASGIAIGDAGEVVTATIGDGEIMVAQRAAAGWTALADIPASASAVAIAVDGVLPAVAWADGTAAFVAHWDGTAWSTQPVGAFAAAPITLAVDSAGNVVGGWLANGVHVQRVGGAELAVLPLAAPATNLVLATRDGAIAAAWEETMVSPGVYAALAAPGATAMTRLGGALDVDIAGAATRPAIALDAANRPVVAWRELIEVAERGVLARWTGTAWSPVGPRSWLPPSPPTGAPLLALHAGVTPVLALAGQLVELNAAPEARLGLASRPSLAGCAFNPAAPPANLLATGCFTVAAPGSPVPHAGLVPYDVNVELWSDGTKKRRWIALPSSASMTVTATGSYDAPAGAFMVKEFALETRPGDASSRRVVETRVFVRTATSWTGFSYQWRTDGTDADLLTDGQWTKDWTRADGTTYRHVYPSRSQCNSCHENSFGPLLGLRAEQLSRWMDYDGVIADQVATLSSVGIGPATTAPRLASPHDATVPLETRMRGYAAANCAHCHNPNHIAIKDLRFATPLAQTRLCESITPGSPSQSVLYQKINSRPGMPVLGTLAVDPLATQLFGDWITSLTSCP